MRRTKATDCRTLPFVPAQIFEALLDADRYADWWPRELRVRIVHQASDPIGSQFEVRAWGGRFICQIDRLVPNQQLQISYVAGVHRGTGLWTLFPSKDSTRVCYEIDLEPHGLLPCLLSNCLDFGKMHSRLMQKLFDGLERHLSESAVR